MTRWLLNSGYFSHPWFLQYNVTEQYNNKKALASGRERPKQKTKQNTTAWLHHSGKVI